MQTKITCPICQSKTIRNYGPTLDGVVDGWIDALEVEASLEELECENNHTFYLPIEKLSPDYP